MAARALCSSVNLSFLSVQKSKVRGISTSSFLPVRGYGVSSAGCHRRLQVVAASAEDDGSKKGQQLWREELRSSDELKEFESFDDEVRQSSTIERDIERLTKKEEAEKLLSKPYGSDKDHAGNRSGSAVQDIVDKVLVADFFFILFSLGWLLAGLGEQIALKSSNLVDSWLPLWPSVFQPALGVFMAGAIVSAVVKKKE